MSEWRPRSQAGGPGGSAPRVALSLTRPLVSCRGFLWNDSHCTRKNYNDKQAKMRDLFSKLRTRALPPLFLATKQGTKDHFIYIMEPQEVDNHLIIDWAKLLQGQNGQAARLTANYHDAYSSQMFRCTSIISQLVQDLFVESDPKGDWSLQELRLITTPVARHLADLLNLIGECADWPHQMLRTKMHQQVKTRQRCALHSTTQDSPYPYTSFASSTFAPRPHIGSRNANMHC